MASISLVLDGCRVNGDTTGSLLGTLIDIGVVIELGQLLVSQMLGDSRCQRRFSVIDMAYTSA